MAMPHGLTFAPPYADRSANPNGFSYWWQMMQLVFDLPNPHRFPALPDFSQGDRKILHRYVATCQELAESTVLSHKGGVTVKIKDQNAEPDLRIDFPPKEAIRGTTVLFRQLANPGELASYSKVRKIVGKRIHEARDAHTAQREEWQKGWNSAHSQLNAGLLPAMADRKALTLRGAHPSVLVVGEDVRPQELIKIFQYGDLIHWGDKLEAHEALHQDPYSSAFETMNFLQVVSQLGHFYLGYSLLVRAAMGEQTIPA